MATKIVTITLSKVSTLRESEVVLFDCNCHLYGEVIGLLIKAIKCDMVTAIRYAEMAQQFGQVAIYKGSKEDCENVASIISGTGLDVSVLD